MPTAAETADSNAWQAERRQLRNNAIQSSNAAYAARVAARKANNAAFEKRVAEMKEIQKQRNDELEYGRNYTEQEKINLPAVEAAEAERYRKYAEEREQKEHNKMIREMDNKYRRIAETKAARAKAAYYDRHKDYDGGGSTRRRTTRRRTTRRRANTRTA